MICAFGIWLILINLTVPHNDQIFTLLSLGQMCVLHRLGPHLGLSVREVDSQPRGWWFSPRPLQPCQTVLEQDTESQVGSDVTRPVLSKLLTKCNIFHMTSDLHLHVISFFTILAFSIVLLTKFMMEFEHDIVPDQSLYDNTNANCCYHTKEQFNTTLYYLIWQYYILYLVSSFYWALKPPKPNYANLILLYIIIYNTTFSMIDIVHMYWSHLYDKRVNIFSCHLAEKWQAVYTILEAFGNTSTSMNANASRFSHVVSLDFDQAGQVASASIQVTNHNHSTLTYCEWNQKEMNWCHWTKSIEEQWLLLGFFSSS